MSRDGQYLMTGGDNGAATVWRTHDLSVLYTYPTCDSSIRSLALAHDQRCVLACVRACMRVYVRECAMWSTWVSQAFANTVPAMGTLLELHKFSLL